MNRPRIVVVGSLNMDLIVSLQKFPKIGETIRGEAVNYKPGGKGANQAVGCARLTAETLMIGCVGQDQFGKSLIEDLIANHVHVESVSSIPDSSTGLAIISHTQEDNCIVIIEGANAFCSEDLINRYETIIQSADILLVQLEIPIASVQRALEIAKQADVITILNPAPAKNLSEALLELVDYITPNETEWAYLCESDSDLQDNTGLFNTIQAWERKKRPKVVITRGSYGCSFVQGDQLLTASAPHVNVIDTTGAGDAFNAALAYELGCKKTLDVATAFAVKCASLSVQRFGAQEGMPTLENVSGFF